MVEPDNIRAVGDRRSERVQCPGGGIGDIGECGDRLSAGRGRLGVSRSRVDTRACRRGRVAQGRQIGGEFLIEVVHPAGCSVVDRCGERCHRRLHSLTEFRADQPGDPPGCDTQWCGCQFGGGRRGDPVGQFVRLIDDQEVMFGQHGRLSDCVDRQQGVIGDHDIRSARFGTGLFGETVRAVGAAGHAQAFPGRDADLRPRSLGHTGAEFVAVAALSARRPLRQPCHIASERAGRSGEELVLRNICRIVGCPIVNLVEAQVVSAALE